MKKSLVITCWVLLAITLTACAGALNILTGGKDAPRTASNLWSDVPRMDGLQPSQMEFPLYAKLLMQTMLNQVAGGGKDSGDWIVFSTPKTVDDVKNFYTTERMVAAGWKQSEQSTCLSGGDQGLGQVGVFCVFIKETPGKEIGLMVIAGPDDQTKQTNVIFIRIEVTVTPTPSR